MIGAFLLSVAFVKGQVSAGGGGGAQKRAVRFTNRDPGYVGYSLTEIITILLLLLFVGGFVGGTMWMAFGDEILRYYSNFIDWWSPKERKERTRGGKKKTNSEE